MYYYYYYYCYAYLFTIIIIIVTIHLYDSDNTQYSLILYDIIIIIYVAGRDQVSNLSYSDTSVSDSHAGATTTVNESLLYALLHQKRSIAIAANVR